MNLAKRETKQIVVVWAGNWVKEAYAEALKPYQEQGICKVYILYDTSYATMGQGFTQQEIDEYNRFTKGNVRSFESWEATCLDLADPKHKSMIKGISPDVVFVVTAGDTHCDVVEEWLDRAALIIAEKPFDENHERIRQLRHKIKGTNKEEIVWGFDHYLVRSNQFKKLRDYLHFDEHMKKQIHEFRFHMLESTDRGMKERRASIQAGMIMDMGSHTPALVWPFGDPNTIRLDSIKAGVYEPNPAEGVTTSGRDIMKSGMETFAEIQFTFTSIFGQTVQATACVGKCVGKADEKYVEVVGGQNCDKKVRLDLSNFIVDFTGGDNPGPVTSLFHRPVYLLVREVILERASDTLALFDPGVGQDVVARLNEWRRPIINYVQRENQLKGYTARILLDDILSTLDPL